MKNAMEVEMDKKKKCVLTTYVYGDKYQAFIPLLIYSCSRAYPEYDILLFLHGKLRTDIKTFLEDTDLMNKFSYLENVFSDCPAMNSLKAQSFRWVLWDTKMLDYDYAYVIDIDMFYIREPIPLHAQHEIHMKRTGLPFDNLKRQHKLNSLNLRSTLRRIKYAGLVSLFRFWASHGTIEYRLTGLHFMDVKRYYTAENIEKLQNIRQIIYSGEFLKKMNFVNDEVFLYWVVNYLGFDSKDLSMQTNRTNMLSFNNPDRNEFRPHHGIHLGMFKSCSFDGLSLPDQDMFGEILQSSAYSYYMLEFYKLKEENTYLEFYTKLPSDTKKYLDRLLEYYRK